MKHRLQKSAIWTILGILVLFSMAVVVTLLVPDHIDPSWRLASSVYQVQMYEVSDPNVYINISDPRGQRLQYVYHLKEGFTLMAFRDSAITRIVTSLELEPYVTRLEDPQLKLTTRLLLLRDLKDRKRATLLQKKWQGEWKEMHPNWEEEGLSLPFFEINELFDPLKDEAFAITETDGMSENWTSKNFSLQGDAPPYAIEEGAIYVNNPKEYRISEVNYLGTRYWLYDENGEPVKDLTELTSNRLRFLSRKELIDLGQSVYRVEGCWYCHTDQTRTLVQDTVLNGSASYPAPPSSANEYIFQQVSFPGTRRIGPDISRVGVKRPHRDWHMSHFWFPQSESKGSIMPSFKHFFDDDPSGASRNPYGVPNYQFEAIFQYLMTKGTRITSPDQAWWLGKDPIQTIDIIEGKK